MPVSLRDSLVVAILATSAMAANNAAIVSHDLPTTMEIGHTYPLSITVQNTGTTTWTYADMYRLGAVGDYDPFAIYWRHDIAYNVPPGGTYTFSFDLIAGPEDLGTQITDWRMLQESVEWFGATASSTVNVVEEIWEPLDDWYLLGVMSHNWTADFFDEVNPSYRPDLRNGRIVISWETIEPSQNGWDWGPLDEQINALLGAGSETILLTVSHATPAWARDPARAPYDWVGPPLHTEDWTDMWANVAAHCRYTVDFYEIWQEPGWDIDAPPAEQGIVYFGGQVETEYVPLLALACDAVKANDPTSVVISGAVMSGGDAGPYANFTLLLDNSHNMDAHCDAIGIHPYIEPTGWGTYHSTVKAILASYGKDKEVICTEIGYPWHIEGGGSSEELQRLYVDMGIYSLFNSGCRKIWLYQDIDDPPGTTWDADYGLFTYQGQPHPVWSEYVKHQGLLRAADPAGDLEAQALEDSVDLSWVNPGSRTYVNTVIRYSTAAAPQTPEQGSLLCDRAGERDEPDALTHTGLTPGQTYHYSAFTYNQYGSWGGPASIEATPSAPVASPPGWIRAGWNLVSIPVAPFDPAVESALDDLAAAGNTLTNSLFAYGGTTGYGIYPADFTELERGRGYWLCIQTLAQIEVTGAGSNQTIQVPLNQGWTLLGHPFPEPVAAEGTLLLYDGHYYTLTGAANAGLVQDILYWYDGTYQTTRPAAGEDPMLQPWRGYWMLTYVHGAVLLIPTP